MDRGGQVSKDGWEREEDDGWVGRSHHSSIWPPLRGNPAFEIFDARVEGKSTVLQ